MKYTKARLNDSSNGPWLGGALAAIAESATASGGRKAIAWPTKTPTVKGSCNCGAVSYVLNTEKVVVNVYCYCKDCQVGLGRIVALHHRSSISYQIC